MSQNLDFKKAQEDVKTLKTRPSNEILLQLYSLYKQGSEGDVHGKRPGILDLKGRAKYDSWEKLKGLDQNEAQKKYIELVKDLMRT